MLGRKKENLLIIFYRNPELGKVKTRLAAAVGDAHALAIYWKLAEHTRVITKGISSDKVVFYSNHVDREDSWSNELYHKALQTGNDLGERMKNAFLYGFEKGYRSISIIGTDCYELSTVILQDGFTRLSSCDAIIGPAADGGYYLLGMNQYHPSLFLDKRWSTDTVARDTMEDFQKLNLKYFTLPELRDIDTEDDLPPELRPKKLP